MTGKGEISTTGIGISKMQEQLLKEQIQELTQKLAESERRNQILLEDKEALEKQILLLKNFNKTDNLKSETHQHPVFSITYETVLSQIFQHSPEAMLIFSPDGLVYSANFAACNLLGYSEEELQQLGHQIISDPNDPILEGLILERQRTGKYRGEINLRNKNGSWFLADISTIEYKDQTGQLKCLGVLRNISEQQEALLNSRHDYQQLFNKANDAIFVFDPETEIIYDANRKACLLYGFSLEEFRNISLKQITKNVERGNTYLHQLIFEGAAENLDTIHFRKDGSEVHLSVNASFIQYNGKKAVLAINHDITEQKKAEKILLESEERFSAFMNNSPVHAWMKDTKHWHYTFVNQVYEQALNMTAKEIATKTDEDLWPADVAKKLHQNDLQVFEQQKSQKFVEEVVSPAGTIHYMLTYKFPLTTSGGKSYIGGTAIDITDLVQTQQALKESELRNRAVLTTAMESIISMDHKGYILEFNPAAERTFGYKRHDVIGKKLQDVIIPPHLQANHEAGLSRYFGTGKRKIIGERLELTALRSNGNIFPVQVSITDSGDKSAPIFTGIIQDISDRKAAEIALRKSEERFRLITENMTDLVCLHNPEGVIIYISPSAQDILGYSPEELINTSPYSIIHPKDKKRTIQQVVSVLSSKQNFQNIEYRVRHKKGHYIWIDSGLRPKFKNGRIIEVQTVSRDVTARKKTERKLKEAKEAAEISAMAKENFLANMSHEIRTPLNGILGMAGLLTKTNLDKTQQKYLQLIDYSARNLLVIINDILDLAKIESGKLVLEQIPFNIREIIQGVQQSLDYKAEEKDILLVVKCLELPDLYVIGDPHRLTQVLLNLVSNAIKFTDQGIVVISAEVLAEAENNITIRFVVKDTGIGIPVEKHQSIFEGFTQAYAHTSRKHGGTGLGLTICKNLIEKQGGRIWVDSIVGKGSEFNFELSFRKAATNQISQELSEENVVDYSSLSHLKVLLAEDNAVNQFLVQSIMQNWGVTVDLANNGKEAIERVASCYYDLILMDIQMPEISGTEATRAIRQLTDTAKANIPIIALTANALKGDAERFIAAGMNDYLAKPFEEKKLFQKISANLVHRNVSQPESSLVNPKITVMSDVKPETPGEAPVGNVCNLTTVQTMARGKTDFLVKLLQLFITQVPQQVQDMQTAATNSDWQKVSSLAHQLKANFDTIGIASLYQPIRDLELNAKQKQNLETVPGLLDTIQVTVNHAVTELQAELTKLKSA